MTLDADDSTGYTYRSTQHVKPTTCVNERAFSQAKLYRTDKRTRLTPSSLDNVMFLRYNDDMWDVKDVQRVLDKLAKLPADPAPFFEDEEDSESFEE